MTPANSDTATNAVYIAALTAELEDAARRLHSCAAEYVRLSVGLTCALVNNACPVATAITWEWCGDGDAPSLMGTPVVDCPHRQDDWDLAADWDAFHHSELEDTAPIMNSNDLATYGEPLGIAPTDDDGFTLELSHNEPAA
jgi:hypothetical protein